MVLPSVVAGNGPEAEDGGVGVGVLAAVAAEAEGAEDNGAAAAEAGAEELSSLVSLPPTVERLASSALTSPSSSSSSVLTSAVRMVGRGGVASVAPV